MTRSKERPSLVMVAALLLTLAACGSEDEVTPDDGGDAGGETVTVVAEDFSFQTSSLEFEAGAGVELTLQNDGDAPHTFTSDDLDVEVAADPGASATGSFSVPDEAGTYEFHCAVHPDQMTGEIIVGGASGGSGGEETDTTESEDTTEGSTENDDGTDY